MTTAVRGRHVDLRGPAHEWRLWSTTVRLVTSDPGALRSAKRLVDDALAHVELAAHADRRDSEVARLRPGRWTRVSATLATLVATALAADPDGLEWPGLELDEEERLVRIPVGGRLDLRAVARPWAADRCVDVVARRLDVGCLISIGGDIATAGPLGAAADSGWEVLVQHEDGGPAALVAVPTGLALATASDALGERWRAVTVVAPDCVTAASVAADALSDPVRPWEVLEDWGLPARLVAADGHVELLGGWPADAELR